MGIGLADARLLVEKFKYQRKSDELQALVTSVRNSSKMVSVKKQKRSVITVDFSWYKNVL